MAFVEALKAYTNLGSPDPIEPAEITLAPTGDAPAELGVQFITLSSFAAVQVVADTYISGEVVLVNLSAVNPADGRRVIDFCSGLVYATQGRLKKLSKRLFLLQPTGIDLTDEDIDLIEDIASGESA